MVWWQALILGLTQGLTEFLPVSSSGHLTLLQRVFGLDAEGELLFDIILHIGTLLAVCFIFWKDIRALFKRPFKGILYLTVASIPAAVAGLLLDGFIQDGIMGGRFVGFALAACFLFTAAELCCAQRIVKKRKLVSPINMRVSLFMGLGQAVAVLPGISRSGTTVCAGILCGGEQEEISRFSFLMSIPVILGSFLVELLKAAKRGAGLLNCSFAFQTGACIAVGFTASALAGLVAIKVMLAAIKNKKYVYFSVYLAALSVACVMLQLTGCLN